MGLLTMSKNATINAIWRLTLITFVFVQIVGVIVIVSVLLSEEQVHRYQVVGAYLLFLLFSGFVYLAARRIKRMVKDLYGE